MDETLFDSLFEEFSLEAYEQLARIEGHLLDLATASPEQQHERLVEVKRDLHTIKGNSGMMGLAHRQRAPPRLEDLVGLADPGARVHDLLRGVDGLRRGLEAARRRAQGRADLGDGERAGGEDLGIRVPLATIDALFDRVSELVIFRNHLDRTIHQTGLALGRHNELWRELETAHRQLAGTLDVLQRGVTSLRMVPLGNLFPGWRRLVHDEASRLGREVELRSLGSETPIDKTLLETASEAVGHLLRNSVVHGIESPEQREAAGKARTGQVVVAASTQGDEIHVDIEDDGRGIDVPALRRRAAELGLTLPSDADGHALVFLPGLSTASDTDQSAGRGMGMAAVAESVRRRGGEVEVFSAPGVGTRWRLRLPLTAAIIRALLVEADGEIYAIPMLAVHETLEHRGVFTTVAGVDSLSWRGQQVPIVDLGLALGARRDRRSSGRAIVVQAGQRLRAVLVDEIRGLLEVVVKTLDEVAAAPRGLAGCTILGDGRVAMIVDLASLEEPAAPARRTA
jgi:two-component system chemotaxis sensor kinase CheA